MPIIPSNPLPQRIDILNLSFVFLFFSFTGWLIEAAEMMIAGHGFSTRGYLFILKDLPIYFPMLRGVPVLKSLPLVFGLPLIEMYGFGGILIVYGFRRLSDHPAALFFTGVVVLTIFELLGSYYCSYVMHKTYWDYSEWFLNFQGRICLAASLLWGIGSVLVLKIFMPRIENIYSRIRDYHYFKRTTYLLMAAAFLCALAKYWWFPDILG